MSFSSILFTDRGRALQAKATAGTPLVFTKIAMGSGYLNGQSQLTLNNLIDTKVTLNISDMKRNAHQVTIRGNFSNADEEVGFYWREIGLFANDPDLGEILYCYGNAGVLAEYIPPESSSLIEKVISIAAVVGNASNVSAVIDTSTFATQKDISDVQASIEVTNSQLAAIEYDYVRKDESTNGSYPLDVSGWTYLYTDLPTASETNIGGYLYCTDGDGTHGSGNYKSSGTSWYFGGTGDEGYSELKSDLVKLDDQYYTVEKPEGTYVLPYNFVVGKTYKISNISNQVNYCNLFTRQTAEGSNIETIVSNLLTGNFVYFTPTQNASFLRYATGNLGKIEIFCPETEIANLKKNNHQNFFNTLSLKNEGILTVDGTPTPYNPLYLRTINKIYGNIKIRCPEGIKIRNVFYYSADTLEKDSYEIINSSVAEIGKEGCYALLVFDKYDGTEIYNTDLQTVEQTQHDDHIIIQVAASSASVVPYQFVKLKKYRLKNISDTGAAVALYTRKSKSGSNMETISLQLLPGNYIEFVPRINANYLRYNFSKSGIIEVYPVDEDYGNVYRPIITFDSDYEMLDISSDLENIDYSESVQNTILEQIYNLFDGLVTQYPSLVKKSDAITGTSLVYPDYANGISGSSLYADTPQYRTYMYTFTSHNTSYGNEPYMGTHSKKKLLLVGGTHGNEIAAPFNLYLFCKQLCTINKPNFYKLLSAFDIYVIPCLNGYGMYHYTRANANKVNINRNYPISNWVVSGADTKESADNQYTGLIAGSEFETKLVMAITNSIKPDIAIDHHNYAMQPWQFYTLATKDDYLPLVYESLQDCIYSFKKYYHQYFGQGFGDIGANGDEAPAKSTSSAIGTTCNWWHENSVPMAFILEISQCINYVNGVYVEAFTDNYGSITFSVAEYTLRNQIWKYCQYVLDKF